MGFSFPVRWSQCRVVSPILSAAKVSARENSKRGGLISFAVVPTGKVAHSYPKRAKNRRNGTKLGDTLRFVGEHCRVLLAEERANVPEPAWTALDSSA
jgi:hypothetical protein